MLRNTGKLVLCCNLVCLTMSRSVDVNLDIEFVGNSLKLKSQKIEIIIQESDFPELRKVLKFVVRKKASEVCNRIIRVSRSIVCHCKTNGLYFTNAGGEFCIIEYRHIKKVCEFVAGNCWNCVKEKSDQTILKNLSGIFCKLENSETKKFLSAIREDDDFLLTKLAKYTLKSSGLNMRDTVLIFMVKRLVKERINTLELMHYAKKLSVSI